MACAVDFDDIAEVLGYKYVIEESTKCNALVKQLREESKQLREESKQSI